MRKCPKRANGRSICPSLKFLGKTWRKMNLAEKSQFKNWQSFVAFHRASKLGDLMLKLESEFKELERAKILKNLQIDYINEQFVFEFAIPEADVMETLENYLFETYGLYFKNQMKLDDF